MEKIVGEAAGKVWKALNEKGALSRTQLIKETGLRPDLANQGIGWLAREGKLEANGKRGGQLKLKD